MCYYFSVNKKLFHSVRSTMSLRAEIWGPRGILLYPWGKGVCKHKTGDCRLRRLLVKNEAYDASPGRVTALNDRVLLPTGKYNSDKAITFIALSLKSCAFFGDDVFTAQVNFVINFTIFLRLSLVIKINRVLLKIGGKSPLFFGNAVRISPF